MFFSCKAQKPLETVTQVDLSQYSGTWYEICHMPARFLEGCECTTATYTQTTSGYVKVLNTCRKSDGKWTSITGKAFPVKGSNNSRLKVQFFWPFRGNYYIIELAEDYSYAVVGEPGRKYLWILSRTSEIDPFIYSNLVEKCRDKGYSVEKLVKCRQEECSR
jgi:apolipoprotein D and lipocalin family protein